MNITKMLTYACIILVFTVSYKSKIQVFETIYQENLLGFDDLKDAG